MEQSLDRFEECFETIKTSVGQDIYYAVQKSTASLWPWVFEQLQCNPEFFQMGGTPGPERELFLSAPELWFKKYMPLKTRQEEWIAGKYTVLKVFLKCANAPFSYSMSHSQGLAIACGHHTAHKIGVDLEKSDRVISKGVSERTFTEKERTLGLTDNELWSTKEACYKALQSPSTTVLTQIEIATCQIASSLIKTGIAKLKNGDESCRFWVHTDENWTLGLAIQS